MRRIILLLIVALSAISPAAFAANAFVQGSSTQHEAAGAGSCAVTLSGTANGNLLWFFVEIASQSFTAGTPSDGTNTWTLIRGPDNGTGGSNRYYSWFAINAGSGSITATTTISTSTFNTCYMHEYSGLGASPTAHAGAYAAISATTSWDSTSATISAGDLVIGYGGNAANGDGTSCTAGSGYTIPAGAAGQSHGSGAFGCVEYNLSAPGGSTNATWTTGSTVGGGMGMISFTPTVSNPGSKLGGPSKRGGPSKWL